MRGYMLEYNQHYQWEMPKFHFHEDYEILLSLTDAGSFWVDDKLFLLKRGSLVLLQPNLLHRSIARAEVLYQRYVLRFSHTYAKGLSSVSTNLLSCFQSKFLYQLSEEELIQTAGLFKACDRIETGFGADLKENIAFIRLMLHLCSLVGGRQPAVSTFSGDIRRLEPVLAYINKNLSDPLNLDDIAARAYLSKHYLCSLFKRTTGFSVGEYITSSRVQLAQQLLQQGVSVQQAGERAGFSNNSHFIRTFHQMVGDSPGRYAKRYKTLT